jgi:hypothetical protein
MAGAFYSVHAIQKFSLNDSSAGTFTMVVMGGMIVGNTFFGYLADHFILVEQDALKLKLVALVI